MRNNQVIKIKDIEIYVHEVVMKNDGILFYLTDCSGQTYKIKRCGTIQKCEVK